MNGDPRPRLAWSRVNPPGFDASHLALRLDAVTMEFFDDLSFGLITTDRAASVIGYNTFESQRAGIAAERVLGRDLFQVVAPCTNNYLVAQRYWDSLEQGVDLDEELDYVFTFRMRPTPVRLRLLATAGGPRFYLAIRAR